MNTRLKLITLVCLVAGLCVSDVAADSDPITVTLDVANQLVVLPIGGPVVLTFTGTVVIAAGFERYQAGVLTPYNYSGTGFLAPSFAPSFLSFRTGTYTGALFTIAVPQSTSPDLYGFVGSIERGVPSTFFVNARDQGTGNFAGEASQRFSILVTVPESGGALTLLAITSAGLFVCHVTRRSTQA